MMEEILYKAHAVLREGDLPSVKLAYQLHQSVVVKGERLFAAESSSSSVAPFICFWLQALSQGGTTTADADSTALLIQILDYELSHSSDEKDDDGVAITILKSGITSQVIKSMYHHPTALNVQLSSLSVLHLVICALPISYKSIVTANGVAAIESASRHHRDNVSIQCLCCQVLEKLISVGGSQVFHDYIDTRLLKFLISFFLTKKSNNELFHQSQIYFLNLLLIACSYSTSLSAEVLAPFQNDIEKIWKRPAFKFLYPERMVNSNEIFVSLVQRWETRDSKNTNDSEVLSDLLVDDSDDLVVLKKSPDKKKLNPVMLSSLSQCDER